MLSKILSANIEFFKTNAVGLRTVDEKTVIRLVTAIDEYKLQGLTGGEAAEKFGDLLGMLQIPYTEVMQHFFARRWQDHVVWITVPQSMKHYYSGDTRVFTISRLEPSTINTHFYMNGITPTLPGDCRNPEDGGTVRKAPPLADGYSNFIINQFVPEQFYIEVPNVSVMSVLSTGLAATDETEPYTLFSDIEQCRGSLYASLTQRHGGKPLDHKDFTLLSVHRSGLQLDNDLFYTKQLHAHKQGSRTNGYFYIGAIPASAIKVSIHNRTYP